ncbi:SAM-dependent methyltransferase [candidate division KSB1 bacterium]|nr:SAM-dependent methyltransferase [candidate division KSB1 bacterium]
MNAVSFYLLIAHHRFKPTLYVGLKQIVFLGAGYDTRSYRFIDKIKSTKIYELDISSTQQNKIEALQKHNVPIPESLSFIPINFKTEKIQNVLMAAGYDSSKKTLFIWEGVSYYLPKDAVDETLQFISTNSTNGSILCFDYLTEKLESIRASEPFLFWITPEQMIVFLSSYSLKVLDHLDSTEMQKRYLTLHDGTFAEKILSSFRFVEAIVEK